MSIFITSKNAYLGTFIYFRYKSIDRFATFDWTQLMELHFVVRSIRLLSGKCEPQQQQQEKKNERETERRKTEKSRFLLLHQNDVGKSIVKCHIVSSMFHVNIYEMLFLLWAQA